MEPEALSAVGGSGECGVAPVDGIGGSSLGPESESRVLGTRGSPTLAVACGCVSAAAVSAAAGTTAAAAVGVAAADGGEVGV